MPALIRCIAIDDEPIALEVIKAHTDKVPFLNSKGTFVNAIEALTFLRTEVEVIDLIFLDINMPDLTGLDVAQVVGSKSLVVFTTAHPDYAVKGFELSALDYLLKPIAFGRFLQAANKAYERLSNSDKKSPYVFVKYSFDWVRINLEELQYVEAAGNYLTFQEVGKKTLSRMTISEAMDMLPTDQFMRVHKSFIVALDRIEKIERHQVTIDKVPVPVGGSYRDKLVERVR